MGWRGGMSAPRSDLIRVDRPQTRRPPSIWPRTGRSPTNRTIVFIQSNKETAKIETGFVGKLHRQHLESQLDSLCVLARAKKGELSFGRPWVGCPKAGYSVR